MWAIGCVLHCLFSDSVSPYPHGTGMDVSDIRSRRPALPETHSMHGFVRDCCKPDPRHRTRAVDLAKQLDIASKRLAFVQKITQSPASLQAVGGA